MKDIISIKKIGRNTMYGIAYGCTIFTIFGMSLAFLDIMMTSNQFIINAICSIISGIGFSLPAIIYENDKISRGLQVLVHMGVGLSVYLVCAFYAGWIPVEKGILVTISSITIMIIISFIIWFGFYIYNKNEAKKINAKLQEK